MDSIYISGFQSKTKNEVIFDLPSLITIFIHKVCDSNTVDLKIEILETEPEAPTFEIDLQGIKHSVITTCDVPLLAKYCEWPVIVVGSTVVAGLCSVARQIIKSSKNSKSLPLLGFREASLVACNETSTWTKFCEVDIISTIQNVIRNPKHFFTTDKICLPRDIVRFEYHMSQSVRTHNIYKIAREINNDKDIKSGVPIKDLNLKHEFAEGSFMTLADVILFPCFEIFFSIYYKNALDDILPLTVAWFENLQKQRLPKFETLVHNFAFKYEYDKDFVTARETVPTESLYGPDPTRHKPHNHNIFTKQIYIDKSLSVIESSDITISNSLHPFGEEIAFDWSDVPEDLCPLNGALPKKRANRKCEQLENLAKPVVKLARNGDTVVDFCSGSGHLGLLLAVLLPKCSIILVENKERSLSRAQERVKHLSLQNVTLLQCNLDYFRASFHIGVSLHACGVATDLVIQSCINNSAHFVCCPCCYGGIHDCDILMYPRSRIFRSTDLEYRDYLCLAHAADQTHDNNNAKTKQGYVCMNVVDTDRKLYAMESGYEVVLGKLQPESCTPKNNLLVGILSQKIVVGN